MAHRHPVYDTDPHFIIDPDSRQITYADSKPVVLIQNDHKSEHFTFELPKEIDGHDMTLCDLVQVHYINIGGSSRNPGLYEVTDLQVLENTDKVVCSWEITQNATSLSGSLSFMLRFACTTEGTIDYAWNTAIFSSVTVSPGINNTGDVVIEYADVLQQWYQELMTGKNIFNYKNYDMPVVYFDGNTTQMSKDNKVTLNYTYGDRSGTCTLKWQGSSSLAYPKKNYTVVFDNAFEAAEGWGEQTKYCLKADWIDFSHCRNVGTAKLWGQIVKSRATSDLTTRLSALVNGGAIDGFPCFVVINGEWQGIYNFNIPKEDYMFGMGSGTKEAILCGENTSLGNRFMAEAVIGTDYSLEYHSDGFSESEIQDSLNTLIRAVMNTDGSDIDTTIAQHLDIDSAIDYYILTVILKGHDIVSKNMILATYDGVKWFMSAYDLDCTWGLYWDGSKFLESAYGDEFTNCSFYRLTGSQGLFKLLYTYKKPEIIARYRQLRELILSPSYIARHFYNYAKSIPLAAYNAESELWKGIPSTSANNVEQIVQWYSDRIKWVDAEIEEMDEKIEQVATEGLAYTEHGHPVFGKMYTITGIGTATDTDLVIPKWINDGPVTKIVGDAFADNTDITSAVIPEGITALPERLFQNCTNLKSVVIPSTVNSSGISIFVNSGLTEIEIPKGMTKIPDYFAYSCPGLTSVKMGNGIEEITKAAFSNCLALTELRLSNRLRSIGEEAFSNCQTLPKIKLPSSLKNIGEGAFSRCFKLTSVTIPENVETIETLAFVSLWKLTTVTFKGKPNSIAENAFFEMGGQITDKSTLHIYVPWAEGEVANAPWGATDATIHYNSVV